MIYLFLIIFIILSGLFAYTSVNLLIKNEALEDFISTREIEVSEAIEQMDKIDTSGAFEADDEVGVVFRQLKETVDELQKTYDG